MTYMGGDGEVGAGNASGEITGCTLCTPTPPPQVMTRYVGQDVRSRCVHMCARVSRVPITRLILCRRVWGGGSVSASDYRRPFTRPSDRSLPCPLRRSLHRTRAHAHLFIYNQRRDSLNYVLTVRKTKRRGGGREETSD